MTDQTVQFNAPLLQEKQSSATSAFLEQHQSLFETLSAEQKDCFIKAITLSDFVLRSALQAPTIVIDSFKEDSFYQPDHQADYLAQLTELLVTASTEEELHKLVRQFRLKTMVHIAVGDLVLQHPLLVSLARLSHLADALIIGTLNWLTESCNQRWGVPHSQSGEVQPLLVYGMGKLGGEELNFSSDIDLIFAYPEAGETRGARKSIDNQQYFTRLGQKLITALNQQTADGFVYRVDMRLRPFGESGPLVLSFNALEDYYQEQGRDWERYAMLKARLIGDSAYHGKLSDMLRPFVYRRYIDFSVIESLRKMKMMIAQEVRRKQLTNNIKLGAGGIREIEFIVQVFQLIRGGRIKALQIRQLMSVLPELVNQEVIDANSAEVLSAAYLFLRRVENIVQALDDKQTQTLPDTPLDQERLLYVLGIDSWSTFIEQLSYHMDAVHQAFGALIGEENPHHQTVDEQWSVLWLSRWSAEESIESLTKLAPNWTHENCWNLIAAFREETDKKRIGVRGRQVLDKLMPLLLQHLVKENNTDTLLPRLFVVLEKILTRTAYLELLHENEGALVHLIKLCQKSEWIAEHIAKYPILLDELIDPKLLHNPPALSSYQDELKQIMLRVPEDDLELQMDALRQFKQAQQLRIAAADVVDVLPIMKVSDHLTALAEAIVAEVIQLAWRQLQARFGQPKSTLGTDHKGFAVVGYGKVGGNELGYSSDLDLVFLHESAVDDVTTGHKEISASQFYLKLAQKIMHIFNTRMASGILYELDMRLRPSGNSGVLTIHVDSFDQYQKEEAWTWEHQALVRARVIYGHEPLVQRFNQSRLTVLSTARDDDALKAEVVKMRNKMRDHLDKSTAEEADIKQASGGLVDIEFIVQYLVLKHCHQCVDLATYSDNVRILGRLIDAQIITQEQGDTLILSYQQLRSFGHRQSLQREGNLMPSDAFNEVTHKVKAIWQQLMS